MRTATLECNCHETGDRGSYHRCLQIKMIRDSGKYCHANVLNDVVDQFGRSSFHKNAIYLKKKKSHEIISGKFQICNQNIIVRILKRSEALAEVFTFSFFWLDS